MLKALFPRNSYFLGALLLAGSLFVNAQGTKPCVEADERSECAAPAKVNAVEASDRLKPAPPATSHAASAEPPLEFEKYVEQSLGTPLPLFGRNLFASSPSTFAPVADIPVPADYVVGPGDELVIRGWGQIEMSARVTVDRSGQIFIPKVGIISVAGVRYADLHQHLETTIQRIFHNFELSVSLGQLRSIQILVVGQARQPGSYTVSSLSTLVNALFLSGGPSARGSMRRIELRRGNQTVNTLDLYELLLLGDTSHDVGLLPGDVIYIPPVGALVAMSGRVNAPAIYEVKSGASLAEVIDVAGGLANTTDNARVAIERIEQHHVRRVTELALDGEQTHFAIQDGDLVRLIAISPAIENAVTLRGNVAHPGRYPWHPGMHLHDLIPNREFLLTREYWDNKNQLADGEEPIDAKDDSRSTTTIKRPAPDLNWDYAVVQRTNPADLTSELLPFNLARAIAFDADNDLALARGDVISIFSERDVGLSNAKRTKLVRLEGEFAAPGVYRCLPGETLRQLVSRVGLTSQSYLYASEFTRESTRAQQQQGFDRMILEMERSLAQTHAPNNEANHSAPSDDLQVQRSMIDRLRTLRPGGRIVLSLAPATRQPRELPEIVLEDGDRFVVPHQPATVGVTGEVFNQGAFLQNPKLRVRDYLRDAGGPTRTADVSHMFVLRADGSVISRKSSSGWWSGGFDDLLLYPGDAIIVPMRLERGAFQRGLRDWSQVIANFTLGAAAVKVLQ